MFRFAKWVRTMCSFQAVSDALLSTLSPANLTKYWHLQHVHRFCISLPPPSFAWVWHNGIPLLHRTCPRAKQAERSSGPVPQVVTRCVRNLRKKMCRKRTLFHSNWHFNTTKKHSFKISQKVQCVHVLPMIAFVRGTSKTLSHPAFFKRTVPRVIMILVPKVSQKLTSLQKDT